MYTSLWPSCAHKRAGSRESIEKSKTQKELEKQYGYAVFYTSVFLTTIFFLSIPSNSQVVLAFVFFLPLSLYCEHTKAALVITFLLCWSKLRQAEVEQQQQQACPCTIP
jgi:hypothetical protein